MLLVARVRNTLKGGEEIIYDNIHKYMLYDNYNNKFLI